MNKKLTLLFSVILSLIMASMLTFSTVAYAKVNPGAVFVPGSGIEGGGIVAYVDDNHIEEARNFATVDVNMIACKSCVKEWYFSKPDKNSNYNNIDYVIYMVNELEKLAMNYTNNDRRKAINCTLGYIRGISINYCDTDERNKASIYDYGFEDLVGGKWGAMSGKIDKDFVNYVVANEKEGEITFPEFFASFVQKKEDYNSYLYGAVDDTFLYKNYLVPDPLGTGQSIDLIHMFAAMDGIYENTGKNEAVCFEAFLSRHYQKDMLSWLGDLHQLTNSVAAKEKTFNDYDPSDGYIDFNDYTGGEKFSSDDLLADIDAFNMTKFFIDCEKNSIANAFLGYYNCIKKDKATIGNRFCEFIYTVTLELEGDSQGSYLENFRKEVCNTVNVGYESGRYWEESFHSGYKVTLMGSSPEFETRRICAKLFCDYIVALSGRSD